jgi:hypothetical protein
MPFCRINRRLRCMPIRSIGMISIFSRLAGMLARPQELSCPFCGVQSKRAFTRSQHEEARPAAEEPQPRKIIRADKAPTTVTRWWWTVISNRITKRSRPAEEAGMALKNKFQMLQVQVYDAENKTRSMIDWPGPA